MFILFLYDIDLLLLYIYLFILLTITSHKRNFCYTKSFLSFVELSKYGKYGRKNCRKSI